MYYRLNPEIYLFHGTANSILCNILNGDIIELDKDATERITKAEANMSLESDSVFNELIELNWMQIYERPVFIDKVRYTNVFNKKRSWKNTPSIENVVLQLTAKCNLSCDKKLCSKAFCPMCTAMNSTEDLDFKTWKCIIDSVQMLKPTNYILTGGNPTCHIDFWKVYEYLKQQKAKVFVHLNDANDIRMFSKDDLIIFSALTDKQKKLVEKYADCKNIIMFDNTKNDSGVNTLTKLNIYMDHPKINKKSFLVKSVFGQIFTRMLYDDCLVGKLTILNNGEVVPCLGMLDSSLGNVTVDGLTDIIVRLYKEYWAVSIDEREQSKCVNCAYRYNCTACKKFDEVHCSFDVEVGTWN